MKSAARTITNVSLVPAMVAAVLALCLISFALPVRAASLSQDQLSNVQSLLKSYGVEDAKIKAVSAVLSDQGRGDQGSVMGQASSSPCIVPGRALSRGMQSEDVKSLQERLSEDGYLSQDNVSGFFGSTTQAAVMQWQADHGIVASGTPETTGWGMIGHKSLDELGKCEVHQRGDNQQGDQPDNASSTPGMPPRGDHGRGDGEHGQPNFPGGSGTPVPGGATMDNIQSSIQSSLQFVSDYSDAFNNNMAAVVTAPYGLAVESLSSLFYMLGIGQ